MNKIELAEQVSLAAGISKSKAMLALEALTQSIERALAKGDSVTLSGFGSFVVADRSARNGYNPATGEKLQINACRVPKFRPAPALKAVVNAK